MRKMKQINSGGASSISDKFRGYSEYWNTDKNIILPVRSYISFYICPRKFYYSAIEGKSEKSFNMSIGLIKHRILIKDYYELLEDLIESLNYTRSLNNFMFLWQNKISEICTEQNIPKDIVEKINNSVLKRWVRDRERIEFMLFNKTTINEIKKIILPFAKEYYFSSKDIAVSGRIDIIFQKNNTFTVEEIKTGNSPKNEPWFTDKLQVVFYSIALERIFHKNCNKGTIYYLDANKAYSFKIDDELRKYAKDLRDKCISYYLRRVFPQGKKTLLCNSCCFNSFCKGEHNEYNNR